MACSPYPPEELADVGFVVYGLHEGSGSQRGLAVNGDMIVISGTGGYVSWSLSGPNEFLASLEIDEELDYRDGRDIE